MHTSENNHSPQPNLFSVPRVGIAVFINRTINDVNCVLIGRRKGSHGAGGYQLPGGHLELFESWEECAIREVKEETDLDISDLKFVACTNDVFENEKKHYITIFLKCNSSSEQQPRLMEPHKCDGWEWNSISSLLKLDPLFLPLKHFIDNNEKDEEKLNKLLFQ